MVNVIYKQISKLKSASERKRFLLSGKEKAEEGFFRFCQLFFVVRVVRDFIGLFDESELFDNHRHKEDDYRHTENQ